MGIPFYKPDTAPLGAFAGKPFPLKAANPISLFFFQYINPILKVGYSRPIEPEDLWDLTDDLYCQPLADQIEAQFMARMPPSRRTAKYQPIKPAKMAEKGDTPPSDSIASNSTSSSTSQVKPDSESADEIREETDREEFASIVSDFADPDHPAGEVTDALRRSLSRHSRIDTYPEEGGEPDPEYIRKYGKKRAKAIAEGTLAVEDGQLYDMNLTKAIFRAIWPQWLHSNLLTCIGMTLRITSPLVTKILIEQVTRAHAYHAAQMDGASTAGLMPPRSLSYMIGVAIALPVMLFFGTITLYHATGVANMLGCRARAAMIDLISRKAMRLSGKSRLEMTNGRINTMVSADAAYLEWALPESTSCPVQILTILIGIALLIYTLGYSALVGLGVLIITAPFQGFMFKKILKFRQGQEKLVDQRVKLLSEIINNIRAVKLYAYERHFAARIADLRHQELTILRKFGLIRSAVTATFAFTPVLAAVLTFVTYALSGHTLDAATIFSALQFFNILRNPIGYLPMQLTAFMDALSGMRRIGAMFRAEELREAINIDPVASYAIDVVGNFRYESAIPPDQDKKDDPKQKKKDEKALRKKQKEEEKEEKKRLNKIKEDGGPGLEADGREIVVEETGGDVVIGEKTTQKPFELRDINLKIPAGSLVCIVGRVGTGKSALLGGMINEMRQTEGHVVFGGPVSYVPQQAWVQSGSIRDNITFSSPNQDVNTERVEQIIDACCLRTDIQMWQDGVETKIGEKGITLSGGQRQRICIARAAYDDSEIVLLDDPLSAVDAHVGHHLLEECFLTGPMANRTRILVTHHLDVLPRADLVLVMDRDDNNEGRIIQQGTYNELLEQPGILRTLIEEFGSTSASGAASRDEDEDSSDVDGENKTDSTGEDEDKSKDVTTSGGKLILDEDRNTGSVDWHVYTRYCRSMGSLAWVWLFSACLIGTQAATVGNTLFLGYWSGHEIDGFSQGQYMAIYAAFGAAIALLNWAGIYTMILAGIRASFKLFNGAWDKVMRSPTGWHDRTPTGRIISRLSKDIEMLDDKLMQYFNQFLGNAMALFGALGLILYTFPYLGLFFIPLVLFYYLTASYYRHTSREVKRVESLLRSHVYSSLAEQLNGLAVIRAFNQQEHFQQMLQNFVNTQNQATVVNICAARWLSLRLEGAAQLLTMGVGLFGVGYRYHISAAKFGVVLVYVLATTSTLNTLVPLFTVCEREMNNVERIQHYIDLETEAEPKLPNDPKDGEIWPTAGQIDFENVKLQYRPDLPHVLKGLTFSIKAGEKVGIIGRTGAGKSSVAQALFRTVELCEGKISVDGRDLRGLGLETLRQRLAIIPQDAFLFAGTVRENIDPTSTRTDAELNDALNLIQRNASASHSLREKFKLEAPVLAGGSNFSAGESQLLALMRALVRNCKVLLLDEATSSVDPETDALIQRIIQTEFSDVTLISIAHRLQTVAYYDRILVLDAGTVAEFDTPFALFDNPNSIFRSLCQKKDLTRADLLRIQQDALNPSIKTSEA